MTRFSSLDQQYSGPSQSPQIMRGVPASLLTSQNVKAGF
jgi:hypothetical protein